MPKPENIIGKGFDVHPENRQVGRAVGSKNRSTIAKEILALTARFPKSVLEQLKELYPEIQEKLSTEEIMTFIQASKAIIDGDTPAYKALMESAYQSSELEASFAGFEINIKRRDPDESGKD
jgi:hypothetical protein